MQIEVGEDAPVAVRIVDLDDVIAGEGEAEPVIDVQRRGAGRRRHDRLEDAGRQPPGHRQQLPAGPEANVDRAGGRMEGANQHTASTAVQVRPQHRERIAIDPVGKRGHGVRVGGRLRWSSA